MPQAIIDERADVVDPHDEGAVHRAFTLVGPLHLSSTLGLFRVGGRDPSLRIGTREAWRACRTPAGPATLRVVVTPPPARPGAAPSAHRPAGGRAATTAVRASAWGPGAAWALDRAPGLLGAGDTWRLPPLPARPTASQRLVHDLARRHPGLRLGRGASVVDALLPTVLGQKVTAIEALRSHRGLQAAFGAPAPGPAGRHGLRLPPDPRRIAERGYADLHRFGIERRRAEVLLGICRQADRVDALAGAADLQDRLCARPGIGPWTSAIVAQQVTGDPDAVVVGDYHLPDLVAWNLAGEVRADDARMLELLEPYRGQRARVVRLLGMGGRSAPRFGPGHRLRAITAI